MNGIRNIAADSQTALIITTKVKNVTEIQNPNSQFRKVRVN